MIDILQSPRSYTSSKIDFYFSSTPRDFGVSEINLYDFSGNGEHNIFKIRKKNLTTKELLDIISSTTGVKSRDIGYCGLKDKNAITSQFISVPAKFCQNIKNIENENIKILEETRHDNKLRIGHLKGNKFFIRLKKVNKTASVKLQNTLEFLRQNGLPNYFGAQRFGKSKNGINNVEKGLELSNKTSTTRRIKRHLKNDIFAINAMQSALFNSYLSFRVKFENVIRNFNLKEAINLLDSGYFGFSIDREISKDLKILNQAPFYIFSGDLLSNYPKGGHINADNIRDYDFSKIKNIDIFKDDVKGLLLPTGPIFGSKMREPSSTIKAIEDKFLPLRISEFGSRRFLHIFPHDLEYKYDESTATFTLNFSLIKGAYATVLLECLNGGEFDE